MRRSKKLISLILSTMLVFSSIGAATQASAADFSLDGIKASVSAAAKPVLIKVLETVVTGLLGAINGTIKDNPAYNSEEDYVSEDFYSGSGPFISTPSADATWKLGSAEVSLVPKDILEKDYYLGGFIMIENGFTNRVEEVIDDMKARVIAIDDNSGRGVSLFATIDCIGMTNYDIRSIRKLVAEKFTEKYPFAHLASVNVFSTHTHSCIDTEGLWTNLFGKLFKNLGVSLFRTEDPAQGGKGGILDSILSSSLVSGAVGKVKDVGSKLVGTELEKGTDQDYMSFLFEQVSDAMLSAYSSMKPGKMTYAVKDIEIGRAHV